MELLTHSIDKLTRYASSVFGSNRAKIRDIRSTVEEAMSVLENDRDAEGNLVNPTARKLAKLEDNITTRMDKIETMLSQALGGLPGTTSNNHVHQGSPESDEAGIFTEGLSYAGFRGDLPDRCPSFVDAPFESITERKSTKPGKDPIKWGQVMGPVRFAGDVRTWVTDNPMWVVEYTRQSKDGSKWELVAYCKLGGKSSSYKERVESGRLDVKEPFKQGFAAQYAGTNNEFPASLSDGTRRFQNCGCKMKVTFVPGQWINFIQLRLDADGKGHQHGDFHPQTTKVTASIIRADRTLLMHNTLTNLTSNAATMVKPSCVAAGISRAVLDQGHPDNDEIQISLCQEQTKRSIRQHVSAVQGQKTVLNIDELEAQRKDLKRKYRHLLIADRAKGENFPRIIGLDSQVDPQGKLKDMVLTVSTTAMLKFAIEFQDQYCFATDATYKLVTSDYPVVVCGFVTQHRRFQLVSLSFVMRETTESFQKVFEHIKSSAESICTNRTLCPAFSMADGASAISTSLRHVFRGTHRLTCYAHVLAALRKKARGNFRMKNDQHWFELHRLTKEASMAQSKEEFVSRLERIYIEFSPEYPGLVHYMRTPNGFFDPNSWRSMWYRFSHTSLDQAWCPRTNNPVESFNRRLKSDFCGNLILSFPKLLTAFLETHMIKCSSETLTARQETSQDYMMTKAKLKNSEVIPRLWKRAMTLHSEGQYKVVLVSRRMHFAPVDLPSGLDGDLLAIADSEQAVREVMESGAGIRGLKAKFPLVYIPALIEDIDTHPGLGGPVCSCEDNLRLNHCHHVCMVYVIYRGFTPKQRKVEPYSSRSDEDAPSDSPSDGELSPSDDDQDDPSRSNPPSDGEFAPSDDDHHDPRSSKKPRTDGSQRVGAPVARFGLTKTKKRKPALVRM